MGNQLWNYGVSLENVEGEWHAYCAELPEAIASGATEHEALEQMREALAAAVRGRIKDEMELKRPAQPSLQDNEPHHRVPLPALLAAKASVYTAWLDRGLSKVKLAEELGVDEKVVRRLLDPDHATRLDVYEAALQALGQQMVIGTVEAA